MANTSVKGVGSLLGGLDALSQSMMMGKISTNTKSASPGFDSYLSAGLDTKKAETDISNQNMAKKDPAYKEKSLDRIAGEDRSDAGKTSDTNKQDANTVKAEKTDNGNKVKGEGLSKKEGALTEEKIYEATETFNEVAASFLVKVSDILEITPEEAGEILADMEISETDLLNPEILSAFALRAMGEEDSLSLLTNETQFEQFQNISEALKDLLASGSGVADLNVAELKELVSTIENNQDFAGVKDESALAAASTKQTEVVSENGLITDVNIADERISGDNKTEVSKAVAKGDKDIASDLETMTTGEGSTLGAEALLKSGRRQFEGSKDGSRNESAGPQMTMGGQFINTVADNVTADFASQIREAGQTTTTQDIANQIMDYMRSQVKPDMQSLEMQLHPASLGNIQINLVHKDGNISANFIASDEQVRAALENQMIQLQERFEEQGIKVNSIEVSVATHGFEQNLEQQGHQEEQEASREDKRPRRITIGSDFTEEDLEEMSDDDKLTAEMMVANGQTMDARA
ncbi:MAG: flagellar hook-length control protein FliK [Lachnospiraceae bacterium]|nr:flagellar hook-length control protein FliK [Lachnospiraceae bacterium]